MSVINIVYLYSSELSECLVKFKNCNIAVSYYCNVVIIWVMYSMLSGEGSLVCRLVKFQVRQFGDFATPVMTLMSDVSLQ